MKKLEIIEKKNAYNILMLPWRDDKKVQSKFIKLRVLYRDTLEGRIENNLEMIEVFENYVSPSLSSSSSKPSPLL